MKKEATTTRMMFVLDVELARALRAAARRQGCSQSFLVRSALSELLGVQTRIQLGRPPMIREDETNEQ